MNPAILDSQTFISVQVQLTSQRGVQATNLDSAEVKRRNEVAVIVPISDRHQGQCCQTGRVVNEHRKVAYQAMREVSH